MYAADCNSHAPIGHAVGQAKIPDTAEHTIIEPIAVHTRSVHLCLYICIWGAAAFTICVHLPGTVVERLSVFILLGLKFRICIKYTASFSVLLAPDLVVLYMHVCTLIERTTPGIRTYKQLHNL